MSRLALWKWTPVLLLLAGGCGDPTMEARDAAVEEVDASLGPEDAATVFRDAVADRDSAVPGDSWRSELYPRDWDPGLGTSDGRFLHDFSYAGYHHGERTPGSDPPSLIVDVVEAYGADATGGRDSTAAIQRGIDAATMAGGGVVYIPEGLYRMDGALLVSASNIVLRGAGPSATRLFFTSFEGRSHQGHIHFRGAERYENETLLSADASARSAHVQVRDAAAFSVGDDVVLGWTISDEFVSEHGMTGTWRAFNGTWQPFFRSTVTAVDRSLSPQRVLVDVPLRYPALVRDGSSLRRLPGLLSECGVESMGLANAVGWEEAWSENQVHVLVLDAVKDCWLRDVVSFSSPLAPSSGSGARAHLQSSGILVRGSMRVTVRDTRMEDAQNRGPGGNGYLFELRQSNEVLFQDCVGRNGRHNFIQNWGFGAAGNVWLRVRSSGGMAALSAAVPYGLVGYSEFHHSLAMANLIDQSSFDDGWSAVNRGSYSTGAGHTATENVLWNVSGSGVVRSAQWGWGYVIGTGAGIRVDREPLGVMVSGSEPADHIEGLGEAERLEPASLYEDQLVRRLDRDSG